MTRDEANRVAQAMQSLNGFVTTANMLNTNAVFHATWQQLYGQVIQQIAAMVDKPTVNTEAPTPPIAPAEAPEEPDKKPSTERPVAEVKMAIAELGPQARPFKRPHGKRSRK